MRTCSPLIDLKKNYNALSEHQRKIADYMIANMKEVSTQSIGSLAKSCDVSTTTVIRLINKLGYQSFRDFKLGLVRELSVSEATADPFHSSIQKFEDGYQNIEDDASIMDVISAVTLSASSFIHDIGKMIPPSVIEQAVEYMISADSIQLFGTGGSCAIAMDGFHKFLRIGLPVFFDENSHFSMIRASHLTSRSVMLLVSHTGESREVIQCARNGKEAGARIIGFTSYVDSTLAKMSDVVLHSSFYDISHYTDALVSRLVQFILLDILYVSVSLRMEPHSTESIELSRAAIASEKRGITSRSRSSHHIPEKGQPHETV